MNTEQFEFFCNCNEWSFWERILPRMAYAKTGMSVHELVDDALSFYVYAYSSLKRWNSAWEPWDFGDVSWEVITGFSDLKEMLVEIGEKVDESIRNQRTYQLYIEQSLGSVLDNRSKVFGVNKHQRSEPALTNIPSVSSPRELSTILFSHFSPESTAKLVSAVSPALLHCERAEARVILSENTLRDFRAITQHFGGITDTEAILVVLRQMSEFILLSTSYSSSFREDLLLRRLNCLSLAARWIEELEITEAHCARADAYGAVLSERLACLHHGVPGGLSLTDFFANEETLRDRDDTDYTKTTDLTENERLRGNNLLF